MFRTGAQMMILVLLAGLVLMRESRQAPLEGWDNAWADFLAMNSRHGQPVAPVTLVGIDDSSLRNHPWPWTPLDFSLFFQAVLPHDPAVLAIDEVLDWDRLALPEAQMRKLPQYEKILHDSMLRAPKLLLGALLGFPDDPQAAPKWQEVPLLRRVKGELVAVPEYPMVERQPSEEYRLASAIGFTNLPPVYERFNSVPLLFRHHGQVIPAFPLQAAMMWAQLTPDDIRVQLGSHIDLGPGRRIPIDHRGRMRVDFGAPRREYSFEEVLLANETPAGTNSATVDLAALKGQIVMLSRTDAKARTIPLAARRNGSPGELFAAAVATILNGSFINRAPVGAELGVLASIVLLSSQVPRWGRRTTVIVGAIVLAIYTLACMAIFNRWLVWLPGVTPFGAVICMVLFRLTSGKERAGAAS